ncbi:DM13 domain-containing protein [Paenibacillus sp. y28]
MEITVNRLLYTASFMDGDRHHRTSGTARTLASNGIRYLRFEHFATTRGPALYVYLTKPGAGPDSGIALGRLKGIQGDQNYKLPAGLDLNVNREIVIFCKTFHIVYGRALLQPEP